MKGVGGRGQFEGTVPATTAVIDTMSHLRIICSVVRNKTAKHKK